MKGHHLFKRGTVFYPGILLILSTCLSFSCAQEKNVSMRRSEKEKAKKEKEARKKYEMAVKQHEKNQSAATRTMMKETKKASPKNTPLKKASGTKCK